MRITVSLHVHWLHLHQTVDVYHCNPFPHILTSPKQGKIKRMLLSTVHCMFMLTCFGSKLTGGAYELICPSGCDCYSAAPDGMSGNNSVSVICDRPEPLYSYTSFRWTVINTLVIRLTKVHSKDFTPIPKAHLALSFILDQCEMGTLSEHRNIFQLLNSKSLNYLTVISTSLKGIDWKILR